MAEAIRQSGADCCTMSHFFKFIVNKTETSCGKHMLHCQLKISKETLRWISPLWNVTAFLFANYLYSANGRQAIHIDKLTRRFFIYIFETW